LQPGSLTPPCRCKRPRACCAVAFAAVSDITDSICSALNLPKDVQGAVIVDIDPDSSAAKDDLKEGDVIQEVNKQPVKSAKDLVAIGKKLKPNEKILMRVYSEGRSAYVELEPK
jgi:serine protease Do